MKLKRIVASLVQKTILCGVILAAASSGIFADALVDEYMATSRWRDMLSRHSPSVNPAFLTEENYIAVRGCVGLVLDGSYTLTELGLTIPVGLYQSWGISYFGELDPSIDSTYFDAANNIQSADKKLSGSKHLLMLSYANNIWRGLSVGGNLNLSYHPNFGDPVTNVSADLGLSYRLLLDPVLGEHLIGATLQNITTFANFSNENASSNVKLSWDGYFWDRQIDAGVDFDVRNLYNGIKGDSIGSIEYKYSVRLGGWILRMLNLYVQYGSNVLGFAAGVNVPHLNNGRDFQFLYQFNLITDNSDVSTHSIYFRGDFGLHREELYARSMVRSLDMAPNDLYIRACKLYYAGKYWDAFFMFSQIVVQFPTFFKNDWVQYYRGACLEKLDMRELSAQNYKEMKTDYAKSSAVPHADLGLMRIAYRDDNTAAVSSQFDLLNRPDVPDTLKFHAYYIMGQTHMKQKQYAQAIQLFSLIPETHPEYPFAQHSLAISYVLSYNMEEALNALGNCIEAKVQTNAQREIINRSYVFLGYMFYEQLALSKAVTALRMVSRQSYYFEDALVGMCWTALRARQWNDCISDGQLLQKTSNKLSLQCEGMLIEAYAHLMQKEYASALTVLTAASDKAKGLTPPSPDSLEGQNVKYRVNRKTYEVLAYDINKMSLELPSSTVLHETDSLHTIQLDGKVKLDKYYSYVDEFYRSSFFTRSAESIKNDIEYALAIVQKISQQSDKTETQQKMQEKQKELDEQIQKLKKEMNGMDQEKKQ
jgi:tetratricopeptide (TPR) repeat protein